MCKPMMLENNLGEIGSSGFVGEGRMTDEVRGGDWGQIIMDLV